MVNYKHLVSHVSTALSLDEDYVARVLRRSDLPELFSAFNSLRETKVTALFSYNTAAPLYRSSGRVLTDGR